MMHLTPTEFQEYWQQEQPNILLLDVREPWEYQYVRLEDSLSIPLGQLSQQWQQLDQGKTIAILCHHGVRSAHACGFLEQQGFKTINITGGIDRWARELDPGLRVY